VFAGPEAKLLPGDCQNTIILSDGFYREILSHPIPTDLEAARVLSSSPAAHPGSFARSWKAGWTSCVRCGPIARLRLRPMELGCSWTTQTRFSRREAPMRETDRSAGIWPLSLEKIEATVAHLGPVRVAGNKEEQCFTRQVSTYLAST
jgi:hypothetical protein